MMTVFWKHLLLFCVFSTTRGLYEDQVGSFDWRKQYIGHVTWSSFEQSAGGRRKVLLAAPAGVIAAINAGPGTIAWRQELGGAIFAILHHQSTLITASGDDHVILRVWSTDTGLLKWEAATSINSPTNHWSLTKRWRPGGILMDICGSKKDQLAIVSDRSLSVHSLRSGKELWSVSLNESGVSRLVSVENEIHLWYLDRGQIRIEAFNLSDRKQSELFTDESWISTNPKCAVTNNTLICFDSKSQLFHCFKDNVFQPLTIGKGAVSFQPENSLEGRDPSMILVDGINLLSIDTDSMTAQFICSDCKTRTASDGKGRTASVKIETVEQKGLKLHVTTDQHNNEQVFTIDSEVERGGVVNVNVFILNKPGGSSDVMWRAVVLRADASISFISSSGDCVWVREEGLASIVAVEMVDLPSSQSDTEAFLSLLEEDINPFLLAVKRVGFQLTLAQEFFQDIVRRGVASILQPASSDELLRDNFNTRKVIVAMTTFNKVYGIDSLNGEVVWQLYLPRIRPLVNKIHILRSSAHPPYSPLAAIVGVAKSCPGGSLVTEFNPINGKLTNQNCLSYHVTQMLLLLLTDHTHQRKLLFLDREGISHCYPNGCGLESPNPIFLFTANNGVLEGVAVKGAGLSTRPAWRTSIPRNEEILKIINNDHGHTHSLGRVRSDRSVQYKYLNPNLVAIATQTTDQAKPNINVYLMDVVNGGVVYHVTHKLATPPINIALCENWIVYTFYNMKAYRHEIVVTELYDPRNETESTWSSLAPPTLPVVTSQSYSFPTAISALSYTVTQKGITQKSLLLGLASGHIVSLQKGLLDPRRNITPTQEMAEEGLLPYVPMIPLEPKVFINYNQTVDCIRGIVTSSTGLESTSLVLVYGLDLYLTRVTPSKQFDMLAEDFDYLLIAAVVGGLTLATVVLSYFSQRKALNLLWQ